MTKKKDLEMPHTQARVKCKCGCVLCFKNNFPGTCRICGRRVYPSAKAEFMDKLKRKGVMMY